MDDNRKMLLQNTVIVLARPEESRNIGASCRAMANCAIEQLRIVGKKSDYDSERVKILAIHATKIWENAQFFSSIKDATRDCSLSVGTTRRKGKNRKGAPFFPEEIACLAQKNGGKIALVFGNERTGLTDSELDECSVAATIPSSADFASLNLSHAVQIFCYEFFRKNFSEKNPAFFLHSRNPICAERQEKTAECILQNLQQLGFFKIAGRQNMKKFWLSIFSRAAITEGEAKYLEKIFKKISGFSQKKLTQAKNFAYQSSDKIMIR